MRLAPTQATRRLRLLALAACSLGWLGCGGSSGGKPVTTTQDALDVSKISKDNYLQSRAERKAQNPGRSRPGGR